MLHTILVILKVAGIIIAAILGILLLILLGILFIPVRYSSQGEFFEEKKLVFSAGWLLHIIHFRFAYGGRKAAYALRIFGIKVISSDKKSKKNIAKRQSADMSEEHSADKSQTDKCEHTEEQLIDKSEHTEEQLSDKTVIKENRREPDVKEPLREKIKNFFKSIWKKINTLLKRVKSIFVRIRDIFNKIKSGINFLQEETTKKAIKYLLSHSVSMVKHFLPKKITASVRFGMGSPDLTGRALGYLAVLYGLLGKRAENLNVVPDFDNMIFEGGYKLKGKVRLYHLAVFIICIALKEEVRSTYKKIKKEIL